jgi:hypothetical protein
MPTHRLCTICHESPQLASAVRCEGCQTLFNVLRNPTGGLRDRRTAPLAEELREAVRTNVRMKKRAKVDRGLAVGYVYCINEEHPGGAMQYVKVGFSTNPAARVSELQTGNPRQLRLHALKVGTIVDEIKLHRKYNEHNERQEWFRPTKELLLEFDLDPRGVPWGSALERTDAAS